MKDKIKKSNNLWGMICLATITGIYSLTNTNFEITGLASTLSLIIEILLFFVFAIDVKKISMQTFVKLLLFASAALITYITTRETVFLVMIMVAILFTEIDYKKGLLLIFYVRLFFLIFIIVSSFIGILPINKITFIKGGTQTAVTGFGLGFNHPNQLAYNVGFLILVYLCYKNEKIKDYQLVILLVISIAMYFVTGTRTLLYLCVFAVFLVAILISNRTKNLLNSVFDKLSPWFMPLCALGALGLPTMMATARGKFKMILFTINGLLGSRFTHSARVMSLYPLTFFGGVVQFTKLKTIFGYSVVDSGYLNLLYNFGIFGFAIFLIFTFLSTKSLIRKKQYIYLISILIISLWGVSENILKSFDINFTVIFWSEILIQRKKLRIRLKK